MRLVLNRKVCRKIEDPFEHVAYSICTSDVGRCSVPDGQQVFRVLGREDDPADLWAHQELLAQHRHADVLPSAVHFVLPQPEDPLSASDVLRVFPHGLDATLEEMQLTIRL